MPSPPERLVLVCGTGTEVGKTWVAANLLEELRVRGLTVAARKPAQSFDVDLEADQLGERTDAEVLGQASGEDPDVVCLPARSYHRAMAPPMAAEMLGLPPFTVDDLADELRWPEPPVAVGLVETAGGVRSPQASDGDAVDLGRLLRPQIVLLVADAGLGTINSVRLSTEALSPLVGGISATDHTDGASARLVVALNRFDQEHDIHRRNRQWLTERNGFEVVTLPGGGSYLADLVMKDR
ncbi:MAG TPA: dethiobiotin synthase [Acidimicrobiales bacterium]|jgi:dethiobiotin synthetase|nr:dethiobiotin synthase [Acidimicrobiales bacterium]